MHNYPQHHFYGQTHPKIGLILLYLRSIMEDFDIRHEGQIREKDYENALRPLKFMDFSGQKKVVENLSIFVEAAKYRGEPLDHTLLYGPPGLSALT